MEFPIEALHLINKGWQVDLTKKGDEIWKSPYTGNWVNIDVALKVQEHKDRIDVLIV